MTAPYPGPFPDPRQQGGSGYPNPYQSGPNPYQSGPNPYQSGPIGYPPPQKPDHTMTVLVSVIGVLVLIGLGVVAALFLTKDDEQPATAAQSSAQPNAQQPNAAQPQAPAPEAPAAQNAAPQQQSVPEPQNQPSTSSVSVSGADGRGFYSGPRCNAAEDPAVFVGYTAESRVVVCQVGSQNGRYYYKGSRGGNDIEIGYPSRSGSTFTAVNGNTTYRVSPSALVITENGSTIASESMVDSWVG